MSRDEEPGISSGILAQVFSWNWSALIKKVILKAIALPIATLGPIESGLVDMWAINLKGLVLTPSRTGNLCIKCF